MPRSPASTTPAEAQDPLAHLRAPEAAVAQTAPGAPVEPSEVEEPTEGLAQPQEWHDAAVSAIVARWHTDRTAQKYAHKGGSCGCRYLATMALLETVGVAEPVEEVAADSLEKAPGGGSDDA